jgi:hypothetical protein
MYQKKEKLQDKMKIFFSLIQSIVSCVFLIKWKQKYRDIKSLK